MAQGICDICGLRPATVRAQVVRNGHRETMELCDPDYRRLARQQGRPSSPLESLFGSGRGTSLFEDFFGSDFFGNGRSNVREDDDQTDERNTGGTPIPVRTGPGTTGRRGQSTGSLTDRLSTHAEEMLQTAARRAQEQGRREVDTEHLLHALTDSDVVRTLLSQFKVSVDDLRAQLDRDAQPSKAGSDDEEDAEIGVSPRLKDALSRAFRASL